MSTSEKFAWCAVAVFMVVILAILTMLIFQSVKYGAEYWRYIERTRETGVCALCGRELKEESECLD